MASFGFGSPGNAMLSNNAGAQGDVSTGPDLEVIQTEGIGFLALAGDAKVQLTSKWLTEPSPSASLLSIASRKGLVAAAGPDALHIATTDSVRKAFEIPKTGDSNIRPFEPQAKIPLPTRISQLAFTADEQYLILSAEAGGGLAIYDVQSLSQGSSAPAFELSTNGEALRALVPNPMPDVAFACAIVTDKGSLLMANLRDRTMNQLGTQVSCAVWSTKGKQLVAGLANGTVRQMTPDGADKGIIPKPPSLGDYHVSSIMWLENNVFLVIHSPTSLRDKSIYHIVTRSGTPPSFVFQKLPDPVDPFVDDKTPHHFMFRLRNFEPNLDDLLVVSSTASEAVGLFSRSKIPLSDARAAQAVTNVFTTTELADDSKRASIPMSEDMSDTFPLGLCLDLSAKDPVYKPIPSDEIDQSSGPLPAAWVLNNEGVLAAWWIVYNESIRAGTSYPHLAAMEGHAVASPPAAGPSSPASFSTPAAAAPRTGFGSPRPLGPTTAAFGSSPFGAGPAATPPAFGALSFGSKPPAPPAFGQASNMMGLGMKTSPWSTGATAAAGPAFGQSGFGNAPAAAGNKVFGSTSSATPPTGSGFSSFANKGGFGSVGANTTGPSIFGTPNQPAGAFGSATKEVSMDTETAFPAPSTKPTGANPFRSAPFVLGTTFKPDPKTANENEEPKTGGGGSLFGSGFGRLLGDAVPAKDADMDAPTPADEQPKSVFASTTPTTTPAAQRFGTLATAGPTSGSLGLFGRPSSASKLSSGLFGTPAPRSSNIKVEGEGGEDKENAPTAPLPPDTTSKASYPLGESSSSSGTSRGSPEVVSKTPPRPNMPAGTAPSAASRDALEADESPDSVATETPKFLVAEDAPLPPDPFAKRKGKVSGQPTSALTHDANLPILPSIELPAVPAAPESSGGEEEREEDDLSGDQGEGEGEGEGEGDGEGEEDLGSEGSGVDVARDLSPTTTTGFGGQTPGFTPQSSFGGMGGSTFSALSRPAQEQQRTLFGEINRNAPAPILPRPQPVSPRSPSPVRSAVPPNLLRPEAARSVSAPGMASQILGASSRKLVPTKSNVAGPLARPAQPAIATTPSFEDPDDVARQEQLRKEIEPTLYIDEFVAVESKLPELNGNDLAGAVRSLFRDVNRMLDNLGLNSRSIQAFVQGHTELGKANGRTKEDLEIPDDWVLCETEDCSDILTHELEPALEDGRVREVHAVLQSIEALSRDVARLRAREDDMKRVVAAHIDPSQVALTKSLPLSAEQASQQNDLRRAYANFSKVLAQAEEELTVLRAKIASAGGGSDGAGGKRAAVPTVEAVMRTIAKMTSMAEKRSGDVDVLETQMRKLRFGSVDHAAGNHNSPGREAPSPRSSTATATPSQRRSQLMMSPDGGGSALRNSLASTLAGSVAGRFGSPTPPPRKKVSQFSAEEKAGIQEKLARRKAVLQRFRAVVEENGPVVVRLEDE